MVQGRAVTRIHVTLGPNGNLGHITHFAVFYHELSYLKHHNLCMYSYIYLGGARLDRCACTSGVRLRPAVSETGSMPMLPPSLLSAHHAASSSLPIVLNVLLFSLSSLLIVLSAGPLQQPS